MQSYGIFCQLRSKLAITHTIVIKWKEKYDAVVVDCYHSLRLCSDRMKMSPPPQKKRKNFFLGRLPLLPGSHLGGKGYVHYEAISPPPPPSL